MDNFDELLMEATQNVGDEYFELAVFGGDGVWRERVYCYELYHLMRFIWPEQTNLWLMAEIDKRGHADLQRRGVRCASPDFLIHRPGSMEENFCVMEVKCRHDLDGGEKDIETLNAFLGGAEYSRGIILYFGQTSENCKKFWSRVASKSPPHTEIELDLLQK